MCNHDKSIKNFKNNFISHFVHKAFEVATMLTGTHKSIKKDRKIIVRNKRFYIHIYNYIHWLREQGFMCIVLDSFMSS